MERRQQAGAHRAETAMLASHDIEKILFLDIETVPLVYRYDDLPVTTRKLWDAKSRRWQRDGKTGKDVYNKAGILAEFARIVCISVGHINCQGADMCLRIKTFCDDSEAALLEAFAALLEGPFSGDDCYLCAHNGKEFDFPFIARRMLVNGIPLPDSINTAGKKPWQVRHLDTMELWKFGDYKHYTSLELLAHIFDIPSPKNDMNGADVARVYWEESDVARIVEYCQHDVVATAQLFLSYRCEERIAPENIILVQD